MDNVLSQDFVGGHRKSKWQEPQTHYPIPGGITIISTAFPSNLAVPFTRYIEGNLRAVFAICKKPIRDGYEWRSYDLLRIEGSASSGKSFVIVLTNGSALSFDVSKPNAILDACYYGEQGGKAVAEALLGDYNPAGRLPVTFYQSDSDLPPFNDYSMAHRTYRYFTGKPLYAFHDLSYTTFAYQKAARSAPKARAGDEVVQVCARAVKPPVPMPVQQLVGFQRVSFQPGEIKEIEISVPLDRLRRWDETKQTYVVDPGAYDLRIARFRPAASHDLPERFAMR